MLRLYVTYVVFKMLSLLATWVSGYVAERSMSQAYIQKVYMSEDGANTAAPPLTGMVVTFVSMFATLQTVFVGVLALGLLSADESMNNIGSFAIITSVDVAVTVAVVVAAGYAVCGPVADQKYFNYDLEGLRAIRAVRKIIGNIANVASLVPCGLLLNARKVASKIADVKNRRASRDAGTS